MLSVPQSQPLIPTVLANGSARQGNLSPSRQTRSQQPPPTGRVPVLPIFVAVALFGGLLGGAILGALLWLRQAGLVALDLDYSALRIAHQLLMIEGFLGLAIVGFALQSGGFDFQVGERAKRLALLCLALCPVAGIFLSLLGRGDAIRMVAAASVSAPAGLALVFRALRNSEHRLRPQNVFILVSLAGLAAFPLVASLDVRMTFALSWWAIGSAFLATAHVFIGNLAGGRALTSGELWVILALSVLALSLGAAGSWSSYFGVTLLTTILYCLRSALFRYRTAERVLMQRVLQLSFGWIIVGHALGAYDPMQADFALHAVALGGWVPILFVLSLHITQVITGDRPVDRRMLAYAVAVWQVVPLWRTCLPLVGVRDALIDTLALIAVLSVAAVWGYVVAKRAGRRFRSISAPGQTLSLRVVN